MAEIKSESVADFIPESVADFPRNTHTTVIPPPPPQLTAQQKQRYQRWSIFAAQMGVVFGTAAAFAPAPAIQLKFGLYATGVLSGAASYYLNGLAKDPLDPDYTDIAVPTAYPIPATAPCLTRVATQLANIAALAGSASTSYNREQYAISIGDPYWPGQQGQAMLNYAGQTDALIQTFRVTARCLAVRLSPTTGAAVTASDIAAYQADIAANGLRSRRHSPRAPTRMTLSRRSLRRTRCWAPWCSTR
jgi:hypothetical protein